MMARFSLLTIPLFGRRLNDRLYLLLKQSRYAPVRRSPIQDREHRSRMGSRRVGFGMKEELIDCSEFEDEEMTEPFAVWYEEGGYWIGWCF